MADTIPLLKYVNSNRTALLKGFVAPLNIQLLNMEIQRSVFYETFNSALGFYFELDGDKVGELVYPAHSRHTRGQNVYARVYTSGKILILGNINDEIASQTFVKISDAIRQSGLHMYSDVYVDTTTVQSSLSVAHCAYKFRFDLDALASYINSIYSAMEPAPCFSGMTSKHITAHVTNNMTKLTFRGKSKEHVQALHLNIWKNHRQFISKAIDMSKLYSIIGTTLPNSVSTNTGVCGFARAKGKVCLNKVKIQNSRCWRHVNDEGENGSLKLQ
jgi:hypothetical protein